VGFVFHSGQTFAQTNSNEASTLKQPEKPNPQDNNASVEHTSAAKDLDGHMILTFCSGAGTSYWLEYMG
jgi:hypothetical protein